MYQLKKIRVWNRTRLAKRREIKAQRHLEKMEGKLALIAIMKNESHILPEWIEHYADQGVDKIILIDNGSTDDSVEVAKAHARNGLVEVVFRLEKWKQDQHYQDTVKDKRLINRFEWLMVADLDEFWFVKDGTPLVRKLDDYQGVDVVYCNWTLFGSSGHIEQPKSVRQSFTKAIPWLSEPLITKWLVRTAALSSPKQLVTHRINDVTSYTTHTDNVDLQLNHYFLQSQQYFETTKMKRGNVQTDQHQDKATLDYFKSHDALCTKLDTLIIDKVLKARQ